MPKFKEGDRVVLITDHYEYEWKLPKGSIGTVASTWNNGNVDVAFDDYKGGHNGDKGSLNDYSHLYVLPDHIEKATGYKFKSGDKVVCTVENNWVPVGTVGIVAEDNTSVPFVDWATGDRYCLRDSSMELYVAPKPKFKYNIVVFRQDRTVIAQLHYGKSVVQTAEATCNPEDTFDFLLGSQIALQRLIKMIRGEDTVITVPGDLSFDEVFVY